ncbi:MAG: HEPN domain-containing protein [Limnochordales bacterium]|nr:HEPN domain-containing protein [Limnochordales bacterium]
MSARIPDRRQLAREWLNYARADLYLANRIVEDPEALPAFGGFHAQQAAEKAIKALLVLLGVEFPKTHDLVALSSLLADDYRPSVRLDELAELSSWSVEARYPGEFAEVTREEVRSALVIAKAVVDYASTLIEVQ